MEIEILRDPAVLPEMVQLRISSNPNDGPFAIETVRSVAAELERCGASEIEITDLLIPLLIKTELTDELATCLRKYTNISEKMLVKALKYFIEADLPNDAEEKAESRTKSYYLNAALSCSFNPELITAHLKMFLTFEHVLVLLNHICEAIEATDVQLECRPQFGDCFDDDLGLLKWFATLIDAHFGEFILSKNSKLIESLCKWKALVDRYVQDLHEAKTLSAVLYNLIDEKSIAKDKHCSEWYSVELVKLY